MEIKQQKKNCKGYTRATHSYLREAKKQPPPHPYLTKYIVKHSHWTYWLSHYQKTIFSVNDMKEPFQIL